MRKITAPATALLLAAVTPSALAAPGDILFQDNFDDATSAANYTPLASTTRGTGDTQVFGFDYGSFGYAGVSGNGLLLETDDALTLFINGLTVSTPISIKYDAIAHAVGGGSTEYLTTGVYNTPLPFPGDINPRDLSDNPNSDALYVLASTDSDVLGAGDFAVFESFGGTTPRALSFMDAAANADSGTPFAAILPANNGVPAGRLSLAGTPGTGQVAQFEILVDGARLQWFINGELLTDVTASAAGTAGVGIGIADPFPSGNNGALGAGLGTSFAIDNLVITETAGIVIPEPTTAVLAVAGLGVLAGRRRRVA